MADKWKSVMFECTNKWVKKKPAYDKMLNLFGLTEKK